MQHTDQPDHHHHDDDMPSDIALRVKALESLLVEKGLVDPAALDALDRHLRAQGRDRAMGRGW